MTAPIVLPWPLQSGLEAATRSLFDLRELPSADFSPPVGEAALVPADSVSWRVFKNPLSLFIGGVAAVIMELAEPWFAPACGNTRRFALILFDGCDEQVLPP